MVWVATAIIGSAVLGAGASLISGSKAADAATQAAQVQSDSAKYAAQLQLQMYNQTANNLSPFLRAGTGALNNYASLLPGGLNLAPYNPGPTGGAAAPGAAPAADPNNAPTMTIDFGAGPQEVPNPNYNPAAAGPTAPAPTPFNVTPGAPSPFLTGLQAQLPGAGGPTQTTLQNLLPGAKNADPLATAMRSFVPGATAETNPLTSSLMNFVPGASSTPDAIMSSLNNFTPGASSTPDASLTALRGFVPGGGTENPLLNQLNALLGVNKTGGAPDPAAIQAALEGTPGYQFTRDQGLKAVQNSYAAKGLGSSGAALRGAADYSTGLASTTYESRLNDYLNTYNSQFTNTYNAYNSQFTNNLNNYNAKFGNTLNATNTQFTNALNATGQTFNNALNLQGQNFTNAYNAYGQQVNTANNLLSLGENAGAQTGTIGANTGAAVGNTVTSGAAAQAAGIVGSTNAQTNALQNVASTIGNAGTTAALYNNNQLGLPTGQASPGDISKAVSTGMYYGAP